MRPIPSGCAAPERDHILARHDQSTDVCPQVAPIPDPRPLEAGERTFVELEMKRFGQILGHDLDRLRTFLNSEGPLELILVAGLNRTCGGEVQSVKVLPLLGVGRPDLPGGGQ